MTVKNALETMDAAITHYSKTIDGMGELVASWGKDPDDHLPTDVGNMIISILQDFVKLLQVLIKLLRPRCRHPKKFRDRDGDGNWYCTSCNLDL